MMTIENFTFCLVCLSAIISTACSQFNKCNAGVECVPLNTCPEALLLAKSPNPQDSTKFRKAICGFQNIIMVCCQDPQTGSTKPPGDGGAATPKPPGKGKVGGDVLPTECGLPITQDRIINGRPTSIGGHPWVAALGYLFIGSPEVSFECAGSLINTRYVLTAAHCVDKAQLGPSKLSVVHIGDWDLTTARDCQSKSTGSKCFPPHVTAKPEEVLLHPSYNKRAIDSDDIALIRLDRYIEFNSLETAPISPVCLPTPTTESRTVGRMAVATGWGFTEHNTKSDILLGVIIPAADEKKCVDSFKSRFIKEDQLCYGGEDDKDTCSGDSGGPLVIPGPRGPPLTLIGIVSYGFTPCAKSGVPAVYTNVASYLDWIKSNLRP